MNKLFKPNISNDTMWWHQIIGSGFDTFIEDISMFNIDKRVKLLASNLLD